MLRKFAAGQKDVPERIGAALDAHDRVLAERLAHTLRGVSGNIGARQIEQAAQALESAIRDTGPHAEIEAHMDDLRRPLTAMIAGLEARLPSGTSALQMTDPAVLDEACRNLCRLLRNGEPQAAELLQDNAELLRVTFPAQYEVIDASIRSFDFEAALETLTAAMTSLSRPTLAPHRPTP